MLLLACIVYTTFLTLNCHLGEIGTWSILHMYHRILAQGLTLCGGSMYTANVFMDNLQRILALGYSVYVCVCVCTPLGDLCIIQSIFNNMPQNCELITFQREHLISQFICFHSPICKRKFKDKDTSKDAPCLCATVRGILKFNRI